jgi:hypothetical protein
MRSARKNRVAGRNTKWNDFVLTRGAVDVTVDWVGVLTVLVGVYAAVIAVFLV